MKNKIISSIIFVIILTVNGYSQGILKLNKKLNISQYKQKVRGYNNAITSSQRMTIEDSIINIYRVDRSKLLADTKNSEATQETNTEASALGSFTFTGINFVPNLNIIGNNIDTNGSRYLAVKLFGVDTKTEKDIEKNRNNFFINEASSYGFNIDGGLVLKKTGSEKNHDLLMARGMFTFVSKAIPDPSNTDTTKEISTNFSMSNVKFGLEVAPSDFLCFYANFNYSATVTNIDKFKSYYGTNNKEVNYIDAGIEAKLTINKNKPGDSSQDVWISLGAIFTNSYTRKIYDTNDFIIPTLTIGIQNPFFKN